jgi:alkyl hydroperoxide reductase subunit AhpC
VLADFHPKGQVAQLYGVYNDQRGTANRSVFVIDKQGIVRFKKTYAQAADLNPADILAEVDKLPKK